PAHLRRRADRQRGRRDLPDLALTLPVRYARPVRPLVLLAALVPAVASASGEPFLKGPYLQNVGKTEVTVMWQSDPAGPGRVRVGDLVLDAPAAQVHEVRVAGLAPGRRYRYSVECGGTTAGGELVTAPEPSEPFSFVVFGDTRSNPDQHRALV